jgi:hypothetical protein
LVVQTAIDADPLAVEALSRTMYGLGCPNGLLFDERVCVILRDHFSSMQADSIQVDQRLSTNAVLPVGTQGSLEARVERWLHQLARQWSSALPDEPEIASAFIPDIVSAASGSLVQTLSGDEARQ